MRFLNISIVQEFFACYPSDTPFGLSLGPDLPWADEPSPGNLRLSMAWILTMLSLLIPAFSLLLRPHILSVMLLPQRMLLYHLRYLSNVNPQIRCIV